MNIIKELYEVGFVFRGFILTKYKFKDLPVPGDGKKDQDLRGAFISAINTFIRAVNSTSLEYLELDKFLFTFQIAHVKSKFGNDKEPIILYGLTEKKRNPDRFVKKFFEKTEPILQHFITKYSGSDFTELNKFKPYKEQLQEFFD